MKTYLILFLLVISGGVSAQFKDYSQDTRTLESTIKVLYEVISGEPGATRDWDRFRNLFKPEARLIPTIKNDQGNLTLRTITPEEYIQLFSTRIALGFFEQELSRKMEEYGTVTHVFSTYETKERKDGPVTNRGINSIQLFKDKDRYYIINIFWCAESMGFPVPNKYLK